MSAALLDRLLTVFEEDIIPAAEAAVAEGNLVFGAAILRKDTLETVIAGGNNEMENPIWHGEVHTIKLFHELPKAERPDSKELLFLSSHEPCSMCLSAITWAGFDNFTYLFSYEDSRDTFEIPHDLRIMDEVFGLGNGEYQRENHFWKATAMMDLVAALPADQRRAREERIAAIREAYDRLSAIYQAGKSENDIPLN